MKNSIMQPFTSLPFMEIREEFDQYGNEIKAEVMNMSKVVQNVKREIESKRGSKEKSNEMLEALLQSIPDSTEFQSSNERGSGSGSNTRRSNNNTVKHHEDLVETSKDSSSCSDSNHDANQDKQQPSTETRKRLDISARLDELIRLEEEAESRKQINAKSSKKIQGSGWKKGFLSKKQAIPSKQPSKALSSTSSKSVETCKTSKSVETCKTSKSVETCKVKKVQFTESNHVKEIPRMEGTRSISSSNSSMNAATLNMEESKQLPTNHVSSQDSVMMNTQLQNHTDEPFYSRPTKMVSMGGIIERFDSNSITEQTCKRTSNDNGDDHSGMAPESKKKLSKFAQRRQQNKF
jgi:hypothetical protein